MRFTTVSDFADLWLFFLSFAHSFARSLPSFYFLLLLPSPSSAFYPIGRCCRRGMRVYVSMRERVCVCVYFFNRVCGVSLISENNIYGTLSFFSRLLMQKCDRCMLLVFFYFVYFFSYFSQLKLDKINNNNTRSEIYDKKPKQLLFFGVHSPIMVFNIHHIAIPKWDLACWNFYFVSFALCYSSFSVRSHCHTLHLLL